MKIEYSFKAASELASLPTHIQRRIADKMKHIDSTSNPLSYAKRLFGSKLFRFRIGNYRVIFEVIRETICVVTIKKRDEAYRQLGLD